MKEMMKNLFRNDRCREEKEKIPIIRYMLYFLIITFIVTGVSLSRYSMASLEQDTSRVAKFNVSVTHTAWSNGDQDISAHKLNGNKVYTFTVTNNSEVAVRARLVIVNNSGPAPATNPPAWFDLAVGGTQNVTVTVNGALDGNVINMRVEYRQID